MNDLSSLIERVERATGPDREIDIDLCIALNYMHCIDTAPINLRRSPDDSIGWMDYEVEEDDGRIVECTDTVAELTSTIDAALALVERKLPQWCPRFYKLTLGRGWGADLYHENSDALWRSVRPTAPLAIVLAQLRALQASHPATASGIVERESGDAS